MHRRRLRWRALPSEPGRSFPSRRVGPNGDKAGVSHLRRPAFGRTLPVHVTLRMARHVYNLRSRRAFSVGGRALARAADRFGVRIVRFSVQGNHVHLLVEAEAARALSRAMQGFSIRVAKGLNAMMRRRGRVLADRYHSHLLRTPTEVRRAVRYVRDNHRQHMARCGKPIRGAYVDPFSSEGAAVALALARTWLLRANLHPP